jgi:hypothetical protein
VIKHLTIYSDAGVDPNLASAVPGLAKRRAAAAAREGSNAVRRHIREVAKPSYKTGRFSRGLQIEVPLSFGDVIIGGVTSTAPHTRALERGRRAIKATRPIPIRVGNGVIFRMRAKAAKGRRYIEIGTNAAMPEVRQINEKWATAIANDVRGRVVAR